MPELWAVVGLIAALLAWSSAVWFAARSVGNAQAKLLTFERNDAKARAARARQQLEKYSHGAEQLIAWIRRSDTDTGNLDPDATSRMLYGSAGLAHVATTAGEAAGSDSGVDSVDRETEPQSGLDDHADPGSTLA